LRHKRIIYKKDEGANECEEVSPVSANGKRPRRFTQDTSKKAKTGIVLLIQEAVTSMVTSASSFAAKKRAYLILMK
jgi:hypothetical protein